MPCQPAVVSSKASFVAYIDESGDEGFKFPQPGQDKGSSAWFVVAAVIARKTTELETMKLVDRVRVKLDKKQGDQLHFRDLRHEHRLVLADAIAEASLRWIAVAIYKPALKSLSTDKLYFYASRYLLERVSWFCSVMRNEVREGDGSVDVIFSNRASMSYDDFRDYLKRLERFEDVRINPQIVRPSQVKAYPARERRGLQVADAIASGVYFGLTLRHGFTEPRYAIMLRPRCFNPKKIAANAGFKVFPDCTTLPDEIQAVLAWAHEHYQLPRKK